MATKNTEGHQHTQKLTKRAGGSAALRAVFVAFILLPQIWEMLAPSLWSQQARSVDKDHVTATPCRLELSGRNSAAGPCTWSTHSLSIPQTGQHQEQQGIASCAPGNGPLSCCFLFLWGFQGSRLPGLEKTVCTWALLLRENAQQCLQSWLTVPRELVWTGSTMTPSQQKRDYSPQLLHF